MTTINTTVKAEAINYYTYFYQHPELSFKEYRTSANLKRMLKQENICFEAMSETGIIALVEGKNTKQTIAYGIEILCHLATQPVHI